jgi:hypothetical protein
MAEFGATFGSLLGPTVGGIGSRSVGGYTPLSEFAGGKNGVWYDPSDLTTLFQDLAGTIPVTASGQLVGKMLDKSGNNNHAVATSTATRPTYQIDGSGFSYLSTDGSTTEMGIGIATFMATPPCIVAGWEFDTLASPNRRLLGGPKYAYGRVFTSGNGLFTTVGRKDYNLGALAGVSTAQITTWKIDTTTFDATIFVNGVFGNRVAGSSLDSTGANTSASKLFRDYSGGTPLLGRLYGLVALSMISDTTRVNLETYIGKKIGVQENSIGAVLGDSTIAAYLGFVSVPSLMANYAPNIIAHPGDNIANQQTAWEALTDYSLFRTVFVEVGLNDLDPAELASVMIARLQGLINSVNTRKPSGCKTYVSQITPNRARLITAYGAVNGPIAYQKWLDFNAAIAGTGPTPITSVDARITAHVPLLNDGLGNLAATYDYGDGLHENNDGRQIIANAWRSQLVSDGFVR